MHDNILPFFDPQQPQESPFDSIRHFDQFGNEFWMARELMVLMEYKKWQHFLLALRTAEENLDTIGHPVAEHFLRLNVKSPGRNALDYKLSRLACYHVALCCDSTGKNAVKLAKHYFAVKTREAEQIKSIEKQLEPKVSIKDIDEYASLYGKRFGSAYEQRLLSQLTKKFLPHFPILDPEKEEKASLPSAKALFTPTQIAQQLGLVYSTGNPGPQKANQLLERAGLQTKVAGQWNPTQKAISLNLCDRKPVDTNSRTQRDQLLWTEDAIPLIQEFVAG